MTNLGGGGEGKGRKEKQRVNGDGFVLKNSRDGGARLTVREINSLTRGEHASRFILPTFGSLVAAREYMYTYWQTQGAIVAGAAQRQF